MWKLIIILILVVYLLNKISMVLFRVLGRQQGHQGSRDDGNIHINNPGKRTSRRKDIKGGDYVDYEEVK